jgi:hypothetical protein
MHIGSSKEIIIRAIKSIESTKKKPSETKSDHIDVIHTFVDKFWKDIKTIEKGCNKSIQLENEKMKRRKEFKEKVLIYYLVKLQLLKNLCKAFLISPEDFGVKEKEKQEITDKLNSGEALME